MRATSSAVTSRPLALSAASASRDWSTSRLVTREIRSALSSTIGVSTKDGQTALTVRLVLANSSARLRTSPTAPCFDAT